MSSCAQSSRRCLGASVETRRFRRSRLLAAIVIGLLGGSLLPQSHAQEGQAAIGVDDEPRQLEDALGADPKDALPRYERARTLARSGATDAALAEFDALLAEFPDDADYLLGRAQMLARLGQNTAAVETAERALDLAPDYEDVWQLRLQLAERAGDDAAVAALRAEVAARFPDTSWWRPSTAPFEHRRWLSAGFGADRLSNGAPDWSRQFLRIDWQTAATGVLFGEISRSERFEQSDRSLAAGGNWKVLPEWHLGAAVAVTEDARFSPDGEVSVEAARGWTAGWGTAFGFRQRDYATGDVASYWFSGEKYIADYRIAYRLDRSRLSGGDSALTHALGLSWYPSDRRSVGVTLGAGEEIETIGLDRLLRTSIANVTLTGNETLSARLSLSWWLGTHEQGNFYRRNYAGLSVRIGL